MSDNRGLGSWLKIFLAAPVFQDDEEKTRVAGLLNPMLLGTFITIIFGFLATIAFFTAKVASGIGLSLLLVMVLIAKFLVQRGRVRQSALLLLAGFWIVITASGAMSVGGNPFVAVNVSLVVIAGLLLGQTAAITVLIMSSLFYLVLFLLKSGGLSLPEVFFISDVSTWAVLTMSLGVVAAPLNQALRGLQESLGRARRSNLELEARGQQLEDLVAERTGELTRRTSYLGATTAIAAAMASVQQDTRSLLARVVNIISEQFGFYHTGLFLLDGAGTWAVLQAASSEGGKRMIARGHRLRAGEEGIVGAAVARGAVRIAQDVGQDAVYFNNPDLPETHSEIALPLRVRNKTLGVLDVQSKVSQAFTEEDITILQAIADQVAVAISNADLLRQIEDSVTAERRLYMERTREAWQEFMSQRLQLSFVSDAQGITPFTGWEPRMQAAAQTGQLVSGEAEQGAVALPLKVRDQVIGVLDGRKPGGVAWTASEVALLQVLAEQLSVALESGRLYRDTQLRAARERLVGEVSGRIRETLDMETMLRTAAEQIRQALDLEDLIVRLAPAQAVGTDAEDA